MDTSEKALRLESFDKLWNQAFIRAIKRWDVSYEIKDQLEDIWLTFYLKKIMTYAPSEDKDIRKTIICAFDNKNMTPMEALQRALWFYIHHAVSREQDVNGIMHENVLVKKSVYQWKI